MKLSITTPLSDRGVGFIIVFAIMLYTSIISYRSIFPKLLLSGDEPEYLLITYSLLHDQDIDLNNNYKNRDYATFFSEPLQPHRALFPGDKIYSLHSPGMPFLLVPFFAVGKRYGTVFFMNLCASLVALQMFRLARFFGYSRSISMLSVLGISGTLPFLIYASLNYPEIIGALIFISGIVSICRRPTSSVWFTIVVSFWAGYTTWIHIRYAVIGATLILYFFLKYRTLKNWLIASVIYGSLSLSFLWHQQLIFGNPFHLLMFADESSFTLEAWKGFVGLFWDRVFGIFPYAPIHFLSMLGFGLLAVFQRKRFLFLAAIIAPYFYVVASRAIWWGGWCPAGRFLVPMLPFFVVGFAQFLSQCKRGVRYTSFVLFFFYSAALEFFWYRKPWLLLSGENGINNLFNDSRYLKWLNFIFPSLARWTPTTNLLIIFYCSLTIACFLILVWIVTSRKNALLTTALIVTLVGTSVLLFFSVRAVHSDYEVMQELLKIPLDMVAPLLLGPHDQSIHATIPPTLEWTPVAGADNYFVELKFPDGFIAGISLYDLKTQFTIPQKIWEKLPDGIYEWKVTPNKRELIGKSSVWLQLRKQSK